LFEKLKERLCCEVVPSSDNLPLHRWEEEPVLFNMKESKEIIKILDTFFGTKKSNSKLKNLINIEEVSFQPDSRDGVIVFLLKK
jgi:hypothetical protein